MRIIRDPKALQRETERLRRKGKTIGLVPTMGALHEGHLSLVRRARRENGVVIVSIFVNPLQFGPREDFRRYPRAWAHDRLLLAKEKTDFCFAPGMKAMYPKGFRTPVEVGRHGRLASLTRVLCGKSRPGHFQGVCTVVARLFQLARPHRAYFGAKDYQQAVVIRRMVRDLGFDLKVKTLPIVREPDGLAMSSRNRYLTADDRRRALGLSRALFWLRSEIRSGRRDLARLRSEARRKLARAVDRIDYVEIVDPDSLQRVTKVKGHVLAAAACFLGRTRLIDNVIISV